VSTETETETETGTETGTETRITEDDVTGHAPAPATQPEPEILSERRQLLNLGYRFLGSLTEAEDVVQETYARWYALTREQQDAIDSPARWLMKVASRICLDQLGSARARRERYVGEWIPEPLPDRAELTPHPDDWADPADRVTLDESVSMAFLVVLESMTPAERVAFVLHDVFHYSFAEVAEIVGRTPAACRQLASSGRRRIRDSRGSSGASTPQRSDTVREFKQAWAAKDIDALIALLDPGAVTVADGGGVASAVPHPIEGSAEVARALVGIAERAEDLRLLERTVNGQPGLVVQQSGATAAVLAFDVAGARVRRIWAVRNPEKLRPWTD
jgi:RNA polymerase sigma-70 factor (ECF subfamily)